MRFHFTLRVSHLLLCSLISSIFRLLFFPPQWTYESLLEGLMLIKNNYSELLNSPEMGKLRDVGTVSETNGCGGRTLFLLVLIRIELVVIQSVGWQHHLLVFPRSNPHDKGLMQTFRFQFELCHMSLRLEFHRPRLTSAAYFNLFFFFLDCLLLRHHT